MEESKSTAEKDAVEGEAATLAVALEEVAPPTASSSAEAQRAAIEAYYARHNQKSPPPQSPPATAAKTSRFKLEPILPPSSIETYTNSTRRRIPLQRQNTVATVISQREKGEPGIPAKTHSFKLMSSFFYIASTRGRTTIRHAIYLAVALAYANAGAAMFYFLERPRELEALAESKDDLEHRIYNYTQQLRALASSGQTKSIKDLLKDSYIDMIKTEGKYKNTIFFKAEGEHNLLWTYQNAVFYAGTIYTCIGYGSVWPTRDFTRLLTIIYATFTVPLTIVITRAIGQWVLVYFTKAYAKILFKIREARGIITHAEEVIRLPIKVCAFFAAAYIFLAAVVVLGYDALWGPAWDLFSAYYFIYLSLATIGLGDVMPPNVPYSPVVIAICYFGLPIMRVVNRCTYIALENGAFGMFTLAEEGLAKKTDQIKPTEPAETVATPVGGRRRTISVLEAAEEEEDDGQPPPEILNNFTIHSVRQFMSARSDVYHGDFGRVKIRKQDLE